MQRAEELVQILRPQAEKPVETHSDPDAVSFPAAPALDIEPPIAVAVGETVTPPAVQHTRTARPNASTTTSSSLEADEPKAGSQVRIEAGALGHTFGSLFGQAIIDCARETITVEDHIATPEEILAFVRFCETVIVRRKGRRTKIELVTDFATADDQQRREAVMALLDVDKSLGDHGVSFSLVKRPVTERSLRNDENRTVVFVKGSLSIHQHAEHAIGSGGTQELLKCRETVLSFK
eukprot:TRINITY_DN8969_c0_g1_i1.p1 TRINITY_DN8969_c0_g1~~TRINITY_DN8969_c0_g1_i1.p1  ORF type:complete len:236 (-),score=25.20 TRINITY_DN8969_c0_g1_i1:19-726(-)